MSLIVKLKIINVLEENIKEKFFDLMLGTKNC